MAKKRGKKEMSYDRALEIVARKIKPILDELREYDLKGGDSDR